MSLQFKIEEYPRSLVSSAYASSDEDMDIDSVISIQDQWDRESGDDEIQVLTCYHENPPFPPQLVAGRTMTTSLTQCLDDLSLPSTHCNDTIDTFTEPSGELVNWPIGHPPATYDHQPIEYHPTADCGQLNPVVVSPASPPLIDHMPSYQYENQYQPGHYIDQWARNPHITGLAISASGSCGQSNDVYHSDCIVCGKSFPEITEEITLGYLEGNHVTGETYDQRMERRRAFQAGMKAGSFILFPQGVSQAAACYGTYYQVTPTNDQSNPGPGVLPI